VKRVDVNRFQRYDYVKSLEAACDLFLIVHMPRNPFWNVATLLEETIWRTRTSWRFPFLSHPVGSEEAELAWLSAEEKHRLTLDDLVRQWIKNGQIPLMSEEQMYWFQRRFVAAYEFLYQFAPENQLSIFPFPEIEQSDLLHWMLIDWWAGVGVHEAIFSTVEPDYGTRHAQN
jgi:hypothetical protein